MPNAILLAEQSATPAQVVFADHSGDYGPAVNNVLQFGTPIESQLTLIGVADSEYRQATKVDLGAVRAEAYTIRAALEFVATPTDGQEIFIYWVPSTVITAAVGNAAGCSGTDSDYTGHSSDADESIKQAQLIGGCQVVSQTGIQILECGSFSPSQRYGTLIFRNEAGSAINTTDDIECHIVFDPIVPEIQD